MTTDTIKQTGYTILGAVSGGGIGKLIADSFTTILLGLLGAFGGWLFIQFIEPILTKRVKPKIIAWTSKLKSRISRRK